MQISARKLGKNCHGKELKRLFMTGTIVLLFFDIVLSMFPAGVGIK